ncbi:hypothetical protein RFI_29842 [Reticulomyxa filosa]|uniref:Uncharacterized protein n=1 Tax=Reticulomyxa filosa TaxID=46433 RepID=X6M103_RETFI|nr:hypothetical protein RFI_29842 [Reticulomyxa filosa]|eukprot:ETO07549.1 hypothetical protein RFI_29842 [Reticulomyxa filosa]
MCVQLTKPHRHFEKEEGEKKDCNSKDCQENTWVDHSWHGFNQGEKVKPRLAPKQNTEVTKNSNTVAVIDTVHVRCRHLSRRGPRWLEALTKITTIEHIHCPALTRADDVLYFLTNVRNLKTLNINVLGTTHLTRFVHHEQLQSLQQIVELIPPTITEFAIPVSVFIILKQILTLFVSEELACQCFDKMPLLENLDFFRLTNSQDIVTMNSWACCLSADSIKLLGRKCPKLKKCEIFVRSFDKASDTRDAIRQLLVCCPNIQMLTIGMDHSSTFDPEMVTPSRQQQRNFFHQLKSEDWLTARFSKIQKKR